MTTIF